MVAAASHPQFDAGQWAAIDRVVERYGVARDDLAEELLSHAQNRREVMLCGLDRIYFINRYVQIYDKVERVWIPFALWKEQAEFVEIIRDYDKVVDLKARQIGHSWVVLASGLWEMLFRPIAEFLIFSMKENEAVYLLGEERLKGMYAKLPDFLKANAVLVDKATQFKLSNGSVARAFSRNGGDSYAATLVLVDEADLLPDLQTLLNRVEPTVAEGGTIVLVSRADKSRPQSRFKQIYRAAAEGVNDYKAVFMPWHVHPNRDQAWYEAKCKAAMETSGSLDDVHEQYPATDEEALAPRTLDKRIPPQWVRAVFQERKVLPEQAYWDLAPELATLTGLDVYEAVIDGERYRIGADPAEGNPNSDDSAATVVHQKTGRQVAKLVGKFEPGQFGTYIGWLSAYYHEAPVLVERNNHGHAVIQRCDDEGTRLIRPGDGDKAGWLSNRQGKVDLYTELAKIVREEDCSIASRRTLAQVQSIDASTLRAPDGQMDDEADAFALAQVARGYASDEGWLMQIPVVFND